MEPAGGGLRHGLLYDLIDREHVESDVRVATIDRLAIRFDVDRKQARRVAQAAVQLLQQLGPASNQDADRQLAWAAQLHEVGIQISHSDYHKHGAYILDNTDAAGFSQQELHRLGLLVLGHRGKLRKLEADFNDEVFVEQLLCLRLAVILCHARREPDLRGLELGRSARAFKMALPAHWAAAYPQSLHLLREEAVAWQKTPWSFGIA